MSETHIDDARAVSLLAHAAGYGTPEQRAAIESHLATCTEGCKEYLEENREEALELRREAESAEEPELTAEEQAALDKGMRAFRAEMEADLLARVALGEVRMPEEAPAREAAAVPGVGVIDELRGTIRRLKLAIGALASGLGVAVATAIVVLIYHFFFPASPVVVAHGVPQNPSGIHGLPHADDHPSMLAAPTDDDHGHHPDHRVKRSTLEQEVGPMLVAKNIPPARQAVIIQTIEDAEKKIARDRKAIGDETIQKLTPLLGNDHQWALLVWIQAQHAFPDR